MFDRALAPRPPTAWQADPALLDGAAAPDFAAWRIPPLQGELSDLSREALARFEAEQEADDGLTTDGTTASEVAASKALPFKPGLMPIVTHFVPGGPVPLGPPGPPSAAPAAQAQSQADNDPTDAPALADAPAQAASERIEPDAHAAATADETDAHEPASMGDGAVPNGDDAPVVVEAEAAASNEPEPAPPDMSEPSAQTPAQLATEDDTASDATEADLADADVLAADALAEAEQERAESLAAQAQPVGVDPDEVARREAEQYQLGRIEGERVAREAMEQELKAQCTVLAGVAQELHALLQNPQAFFEPLKRMALHLAEQISLTQWQTSTHSLEALIRRCLDTLDHATHGAVVIELHPLDKARLQAAAPAWVQGMRLDANEDLRVGSVRLYANDTVVEDLIEHRLQAIVRSLHIDAQAWAQHSLLLKNASSADATQALVLPIDAPPEMPPATEPPPAPEDDDVHP